MSKSDSDLMELEDRDPQEINKHLEICWEDILGEPNTIRSPECAWTVSRNCYKYSRTSIYICLSVLCAPIAACFVGVSFAVLQFQHIWCVAPCLKIWQITCDALKKFIHAFTYGVLIPLVEALAYCFSKIKITRKEELGESDTVEDFKKKMIV